MSDTWDWVRAHPLLAGALGCALVSTAHAEYTLATSTDVNEWVALAVPGALDLYVIQALRVRRDVATAVLVMVAANVVSHLLVAGLYPKDIWWQVGVVSAVGALAPVLLWRVHSLERTRTRTELLWGVEAGAVKAPECAPSTPPPAVLRPASALASTAPDHVPASWMEDEYPETHPSAPHSIDWGRVREINEAHSKTSAVPYLAPVPDLPDEYKASAVHVETSTPVLRDTDWEYLPGAQEYVDKYSPATVKGLRRELNIGQDRAERLLSHLGVRP